MPYISALHLPGSTLDWHISVVGAAFLQNSSSQLETGPDTFYSHPYTVMLQLDVPALLAVHQCCCDRVIFSAVLHIPLNANRSAASSFSNSTYQYSVAITAIMQPDFPASQFFKEILMLAYSYQYFILKSTEVFSPTLRVLILITCSACCFL